MRPLGAAGASIEGMEEISVRALAKLEQVLPERLRRRVHAVHTNVSSMPWGIDTAPVDADALAVPALARRGHEPVHVPTRPPARANPPAPGDPPTLTTARPPSSTPLPDTALFRSLPPGLPPDETSAAAVTRTPLASSL